MTDKEIQAIENESAELLTLIREQREEENALLTVPQRVFDDTSTPSTTRPDKAAGRGKKIVSPQPRHAVSPWWLAAAVVVGLAVGLALPRPQLTEMHSETRLMADTLHCRSLADGDLNTTLLVTL